MCLHRWATDNQARLFGASRYHPRPVNTPWSVREEVAKQMVLLQPKTRVAPSRLVEGIDGVYLETPLKHAELTGSVGNTPPADLGEARAQRTGETRIAGGPSAHAAWLSLLPSASASGLSLSVGASSGLSSSDGVVLLKYSGIIMTVEMHLEFSLLYYCPTAVRCTALDYTEKGRKYEFVIVGDPVSHAAIINDAKGTGQPGTHRDIWPT